MVGGCAHAEIAATSRSSSVAGARRRQVLGSTCRCASGIRRSASERPRIKGVESVWSVPLRVWALLVGVVLTVLAVTLTPFGYVLKPLDYLPWWDGWPFAVALWGIVLGFTWAILWLCRLTADALRRRVRALSLKHARSRTP